MSYANSDKDYVSDSDSETEMEDVDNAVVEFDNVTVDEGIDDLDRQFSVTMSVSNTDNTAHGVEW